MGGQDILVESLDFSFAPPFSCKNSRFYLYNLMISICVFSFFDRFAFVMHGVIGWEGMSVMRLVLYSSQEPQIKAGMHQPVIEGTRKHFFLPVPWPSLRWIVNVRLFLAAPSLISQDVTKSLTPWAIFIESCLSYNNFPCQWAWESRSLRRKTKILLGIFSF